MKLVSSIGMIGGADGPTVVFVSGKPWLSVLICVAVLAGVVILALLLRKRK